MTTGGPDSATTAVRRPRRPLPGIGWWAGVAAFVVVTVWSADAIDFTLAPIVSDVNRVQRVVAPFLQPEWSYLADPGVQAAWWQTLSIAVLATLGGCALALLVALLASPVSSPHRVVHVLAKQVLSVLRSLPDVALGLLFVAALGVGSLAGILALTLFNLGICAKLTAETIDAVDPGPLEAVDATGAGTMARARVAIVPQILPNFISYVLYVFELNLRASVVIGLVGGGGIGSLIALQLKRIGWDGPPRLAAIVVMLFVLVFLIDLLSRYLRRRLV